MYRVEMCQTTKMTSKMSYDFVSKKKCWDWLKQMNSIYPFIIDCISDIKEIKKHGSCKSVIDMFLW